METKRLIAVFCLFLIFSSLTGEIVSIGNGSVLNQGLPIEPVARYSYSQQLFTASEISCQGVITSLGFRYNANSGFFYNAIKEWKIWLGHSNRNTLNSWIPVDSLSLVYDNTLQISDFTAGLPGSGWLVVTLEQPFYYNGTDKLVVAVDENSNEYGSTSDDFYCTAGTQQYAIQYQNANINPDPLNPPESGWTLKTHRSNLQISIEAIHYTPVQPNPANGSTGVGINGNLSWLSSCSSFDLALGTHPDSLLTLGSGINTSFWQLESPLAYSRQYFWRVTGFLDSVPYPSQIWNFTTVSESCSPPRNLSGFYNGSGVSLSWQAPVSGTANYYKIYRNSAFLSNCLSLNMLDTQVQAGQTYFYQVTAVTVSGSESAPSNLISVSVPNSGPVPILSQGFESCLSFSQQITGWQNLDLDASQTWDWQEHSFPGEGSAQAWTVFEPGLAIPPLNTFQPYSGQKMAVSLSATNPPNNDWLISPALHLGNSATLEFKARSADVSFGFERLRVLISTTSPEPSAFTPLSASPFLQVPQAWTNYSYDLTSYANQRVYLAWNCVSVDALALGLDEIKVFSDGGWVTVQDEFNPAIQFYSIPNPSSDAFSVCSKSNQPFSLELFNLRGQRLVRAENLFSFDSSTSGLKLASGIYFIRISSASVSQTIRQVIIK